MDRIQVAGRRFGFKIGITFLGVKEYPRWTCRHGRGVLCGCSEINTPLPPVMLETVKRFVEIISVLQGEIEGLTETIVNHEVKIRQIENRNIKGA